MPNDTDDKLAFDTVLASLQDPALHAWRIATYGRMVYFDADDATYRTEDDDTLALQPLDPARALERDVGCAVSGVFHVWMGDCPIARLNPIRCTTCRATYYTAAAIAEHIMREHV